MKFGDFESFERGLKEGLPVYAVVSADDFERRRALDLLLKRITHGTADANLCVKSFSGENASSAQILEELETASLFAQKVCVLVREADGLKKEALESLSRYFSKPLQNTLVLEAESLSPSCKFYKQIVDCGAMLHIPVEKEWQKEKNLEVVVARLVAECGKTLDGASIKSLVRLVGVSGTRLSSEVEKLVCYVGSRKTITAEDIAAICSEGSTATVWQLGEAIVSRDLKGAYTLAARIVQEEGAIIGPLAQLRKQIQTLYEVCSILANGGGPDAVTEVFAYMRGRLLQQNMERASKYGLQRFKQALLAIDRTSLAARNSNTDPALLIDMLIARIAA